MYNLTIHPTSDPFPFAALALSSFLKGSVDVNISYEGDQPGCVLTRTSDGTRIEENENVVRALAKEAKAESNSTQVMSI